MKATVQYFPVVLFIMLYKVVLRFESVDEILKRDHSNKSYCAVLFCNIIHYVAQATSHVCVCQLKFLKVTEVHYVKDSEL